MTTVYTHINPFSKRAIAFFKQCIYEIGERGKISSVLDELLLKREFFNEFLVAHGPSLPPQERDYVRDQAAEVETELSAAYVELTILKSILKSLNPCGACDGRGEHRYSTPMYGSDPDPAVEKCEACGGDGVVGEVPARGG